ncbi:MAG: hypothetical protein JW999_05080 [Methanotrichaceae archaeon]|nr:hypothetical protein [Methanotrichaceae archaeon]
MRSPAIQGTVVHACFRSSTHSIRSAREPMQRTWKNMLSAVYHPVFKRLGQCQIKAVSVTL